MSDDKIISFKGSSSPHSENSEPNGDQMIQSRLAAILAADVAGYTRLVEKDTAGTVAAWHAARDNAIEPGVSRHGGRVIKLTGDGFLAEFQTVQAAVECAIEMQDELLNGPLKFRMGVSMGDIIDDGRDVHGEGVNIAARLEALSDPGGICVSGDVYNQVCNRIDEAFENQGDQQVKHVSRPIRVYALQRFVANPRNRTAPTKTLNPSPTRTINATMGVVLISLAAGILAVVTAGFWVFGFQTNQVVRRVAEQPPGMAPVAGIKTVARETSSSMPKMTTPTVDRNFTDCDVCPEMVVVPAGTFMMGWKNGPADEKVVHQVTIARDFAVGKFEITFKQWRDCLSGGGCRAYHPDDKGWGQGRRPVIRVSWNDAQAYVSWLSGRSGKKYRLLTEAEWEYAARADTSTLYPWGVTHDAGKANYGLFRGKTVPVGFYDANAFGLHDMIGNVWEWTADCYDESAYRTHAAYPAAVIGDAGSCPRVLRGGAWDVDMSDGADLLRTSIREKGNAEGRYSNYGFRVARNLE